MISKEKTVFNQATGEESSDTEKLRPRRGFPTAEEERTFRQNFFQNYREKAKKLLADEAPGWHYSQNEFEQFLAFLYGIYFFNKVVGDELMSQNLNDSRKDKYENRNWLRELQGQEKITPSVDNLEDWPLIFPLHNPHKMIAGVDPETSLIMIFPRSIQFVDPLKKRIFYPKTSLFSFLRMSYKMSPLVEWIIIGVEEAGHSYLAYIERTRYQRSEDPERYKLYHTQLIGPLKDILPRPVVEQKPQWVSDLLYHAFLGDEFSSFILKSEFIRRYEPEVWNSGYVKFDAAVRKRRKKEVSRMREKT